MRSLDASRAVSSRAGVASPRLRRARQPIDAGAVGQLPIDQPGVVGLVAQRLRCRPGARTNRHGGRRHAGSRAGPRRASGRLRSAAGAWARTVAPPSPAAPASGALQVRSSRPNVGPCFADTAPRAPHVSPRGPSITTERLILAASVFWALALNRPFFAAALRAQAPDALANAGFVVGLALMLVALQALLLGLVGTRHTIKPLLALLTLVGALAMHYMQAYGVVIDPSMVRNALHTDPAETRELLSWSLALDLLLYAALPIALAGLHAHRAAAVEAAALRARALLLAGAARAVRAGLMWQFQPLGVDDAQPQGSALPGHAAEHAVVAGQRARRRRPRRRAAAPGHRPGRGARPELGRAQQAAPGRDGRRRDGACRQLGPERLCAPDHTATGATAGGQLHRRQRLRHQHRGLAALHVCARRPAQLRRSAHPRQRIAAARGRARRRGGALARQPERLQGRLRRPAARHRRAPRIAPGPVPGRPLLGRRPAARPRRAPAQRCTAATARSCWCCTCSATTGRRTSAATRRPSSASRRCAATTTSAAARARRSSTPTTTRCSTPTMCWRR